MAAGEEDTDAVLSDVEEEDNPPDTVFDGTSSSTEDVSIERFREVVAELDRERKAREALENSKSELQGSFNRLKVLAHEAIKKREEISRQRDEVSRCNERLSAQLAEAVKEKDEMLKQKDDLVQQLEESVKAKDSSRSEIETAAQMLVTGIDKISGKVSNYKNFMAGGFPRSQKYTGLPAVAYGVIKRSNEIVEELHRQIESVTKSRNEARQQMDQRNYEIAIEVSHLEASISGLREEVSKRDSIIEGLEKSITEKDGKISKLETELLGMQDLVSDSGAKLKNLELRIDSQRPLLADQLAHVSKLHEQIFSVIKILDDDKKSQSDLSDSLFLPQETDVEENIRACLAGLESISDLSSIVYQKTRDLVVERNREVKSLNESVTQLVKEKEHVGSLLRSALSRRMSTDLSSKTNELFRVTETGLREAGIHYRFSNHTSDGTALDSNNDAGNLDNKDDEIYTLAGALENIIKQSQLEIIELQHTVDELRAETSLLKENAEAQAKELMQRKEQVEKLKDKERVANENVEGLMMDIAAAEEEITRWKVAAQQEAEAGRAIEQEYMAQIYGS
ncbi:myosin-3-like isoform X2 [Cynara cardunculus var. scolymus]|uniref:myosin-3-like isoform X2 n=1 Tax=Cynara cardunculus var. scolymus TaxID=59895 RepID=UPI000D62A45A|nr:myosin-3-like isoform X2 [Cynara cardunculus var. scolymus]